MPRKRSQSEEKTPTRLTLHTAKVTPVQMDKVRTYCEDRMWEEHKVDYARFGFKGPAITVVGYESGKLVVQGKETESFVINFLEPEVLGEARLGYDEVHHPDWFEPHAGLDESGKGDLFGTVVTACVVAGRPEVEQWIKSGIRDSKTISDARILELDRLIRETPGAAVATAYCTMPRYNELMARPGANLNRLLGWQHAKSLEKALSKRFVPRGLLDQFSKFNFVASYYKNPDFQLEMRVRAETDPVVAAASVVARAEYVRQMKQMSGEFGETLVKGAGPKAKAQLQHLLGKLGTAALPRFAKIHFRTVYEVLSEMGRLEEYPVPKPPPRPDPQSFRKKTRPLKEDLSNG